MSKEKIDNEIRVEDRDMIIKALEVLFAADYINKKKLYYENFLRGMAFGVGGVIGATILIALIIWFLSLFDTLPLIGPLFDNTKQTIEQSNQ